MAKENIEKPLSPESSLWDKFMNGNNDAYSLIYKQNIQRLYQYGLFLSADREFVLDCIQDVFVKIYSNRSNLSAVNNISVYLTIALRNTILNAKRKNRVIELQYDEDIAASEKEDDVTPELSYIKSETEKIEKKQVEVIMSILTSRQKEVIYYRFIQDLSVDEISKIMDMNIQSVSNLIQRSLQRIRVFFKKGANK